MNDFAGVMIGWVLGIVCCIMFNAIFPNFTLNSDMVKPVVSVNWDESYVPDSYITPIPEAKPGKPVDLIETVISLDPTYRNITIYPPCGPVTIIGENAEKFLNLYFGK